MSITRGQEGFNSNTTTRRNDSVYLQYPTVATSKFDLQFFDYERYTLNNTSIKDTIITLKNTLVFLSNASVIGSRIMAEGMMEYSVFIENCIFDGSAIVIDSAINVTIMHSKFIMEDIGKDEKPNHVRELSFFTGRGGPSVCDCRSPIFPGPPLGLRRKILVPPFAYGKKFWSPPLTS